jgi:hypothetical protein
MLWDNGEIPTCSYCDANFYAVESLHETGFSGELVCDDEICRTDLMNNILSNEVSEITEDEKD